MQKLISIFILLTALGLTGFACGASSSEAASVSGVANAEEAPPSYWLRNQEGWFWYQDPLPDAEPRRKAQPEEDSRPRELIEFDAMQKRLEDLKRIAVMNPSDANMKSY